MGSWSTRRFYHTLFGFLSQQSCTIMFGFHLEGKWMFEVRMPGAPQPLCPLCLLGHLQGMISQDLPAQTYHPTSASGLALGPGSASPAMTWPRTAPSTSDPPAPHVWRSGSPLLVFHLLTNDPAFQSQAVTPCSSISRPASAIGV